jgi:hypothetical protein
LREVKDVIDAIETAGMALATDLACQSNALKTLQFDIAQWQTIGRIKEPIGFAVIPDHDGMIIHTSESSAREEAAHLIVEESDAYGTAHLVAILDTAEMQISWKRAA